MTDLHVHTVLSPCASVEMTPSLVVETALELGLDIIAVTDHNAGDNAKAVWQAARPKARAARGRAKARMAGSGIRWARR